ncbi:MAG TPA: hypothetical protein VF642_04965, partial [Propionibacteriaceae bacterium]
MFHLEFDFDGIMLLAALVIIVAIISARIGTRVGLPSLLLFLGLGMLMGESGPLSIPFEDAQLARDLG